MSEKFNVKVNQFPSLTWNFLDINRSELDSQMDQQLVPEVTGLQEGCLESSVNVAIVPEEIDTVETGMGKQFDFEFDSALSRSRFDVHVFTVKENSVLKQNVFLSYNCTESKNYVDDVVIYAGKNSVSSFIFDFTSAKVLESAEGSLGIRVRILAEENACIKISYVNMLESGFTHFVSMGSLVKDNAKVEVTEIQLGGKKVYSGSKFNLSGYKAGCDCHTAYLVKEDSFLDINYVALHTGRETESRMLADGIVMNKGNKTWRGTIDFKKGCVEAKGDEQENVLLLSPELVNKTLPVILCDEEAVEGRHGSTIGKLGKEILFYMQSRGVDEETAKRLMIRAKITSCCRFIPDESLVSRIKSYVDGAF